ncbi:MAG: FG-GAP repeat protein [Acidobacteria bacterium]|nr:FG-GAP repeat protein [Acidobacteriota bacterium]
MPWSDLNPAVFVREEKQPSGEAESNPFLAAIRENFGDPLGQDSNLTPAPTPPPAPSQTEVVPESATTPPASGGLEVAQTLPPKLENAPPSYSSAFVVIGDFGGRKLQMARAAKSSESSFVVEGSASVVRFESGLDFGPLQSLWLGGAAVQPFPDMVVVDASLNLVDWYSGVERGQFVFQNGFYFSPGVPAGAATADINGDRVTDLLIGGPLRSSESDDLGLVYLYFQQNRNFVLQRRILVGFPIGALHVTRSGGQTRVLAVDSSLTRGELITLDAAGFPQGQPVSVSAVERQDARLTFSSGASVLVRLAHFADAAFLGSYGPDGFHLIGAVESRGAVPFIAIGDVRQDGQQRCWVHF